MNRKKSILCMLAASENFAFMAATVKLSGGQVPLMQQIFFRNFIIFLLAFFTMKKQGISFVPSKGAKKDLFFRCLFGYLGMLCVFYANRNLHLADAQILQKLSPFFITVFAVTFLEEKLTKWKAVSLCMAFMGAVVVIRPHGDFTLFPFMVAVGSAFFSALAYTLLRKLHREPGSRIIFYFGAFTSAASFPFMLMQYKSLSLKYWGLLILIGVFAGLGQNFVTKAYRYAPASEVSIFDYTGVVISPIIGFLLFQEKIGIRTLLGMVLIVLSGYLSFYFNRKKEGEKWTESAETKA